MSDTNIENIQTIIRQWEKAIQSGDKNKILANHPEDILMFDVPD